MRTRITDLFGIDYPIVSGGMVWCSGWRLAAAVSNAGGLGLIGAGSMYPEVLREHIVKCKAATDKPFGVNVPLMYPGIEEVMAILVEENVKIVFTSAGNPAVWTSRLKEKGITVVHVVSSSKFALKAEAAGADAVVAEGFEAGGHNGREETTTMVLIPAVSRAVKIPVIAAGGIGTGGGMLAAMALGAEGVQMGTRFALSAESSADERFKRYCLSLPEGETMLCLKKTSPTRLAKNHLYKMIEEAEQQGASADELRQIVGVKRPKKGIFEGDTENGMIEIGQIAAMVDEIETCDTILKKMIAEYTAALEKCSRISVEETGHPVSFKASLS